MKIETNLSNIFVFYRFEKYISGKYLGEVARVVLRDLIADGYLFTRAPNQFPTSWKFDTENVSAIEK